MGRFIPRGSGPQGRRGKAVWLVLLTCCLFLAAPAGLLAQPAESPRIFYFPERAFYIPFTLHENDPRIDILLNVSTDGRTFHYSASAKPPDRRFHFTAPADGWYHFIVQTRDHSGTLTPERLTSASSNLRICVDTQSPIIESFTADSSSENAPPIIRWKISEANLKEIVADYRLTSGGEWVPLFLPAEKEGTHTWKPLWGGELEVRMQAVDKAEHRSEVRTLRLRVANNVTRMPPPQDSAGAGSGKIMFVKSKTFQLNYTLDQDTVGPSNVERVDIWKLHPGPGQVWRKCSEKGPATGPAAVTVETSGRWGFRLIPRSGVGLAERDPQPGDRPDIWVEVDDRPPQVKVTNVVVTPEGDDGYVIVSWKADDAFLRAMPITILKKDPKGGDWVELPGASSLPNTGNWRQKIEDLKLGPCYEFSLMVTAVDEAGNKGSDPWRENVKVDLRIPRIKSIDVKPHEGAPGGGQQSQGGASGLPMGGNLPMDNGQHTSPSAPSSLKGSGRNWTNLPPQGGNGGQAKQP